jgi:hypothetical protein
MGLAVGQLKEVCRDVGKTFHKIPIVPPKGEDREFKPHLSSAAKIPISTPFEDLPGRKWNRDASG